MSHGRPRRVKVARTLRLDADFVEDFRDQLIGRRLHTEARVELGDAQFQRCSELREFRLVLVRGAVVGQRLAEAVVGSNQDRVH